MYTKCKAIDIVNNNILSLVLTIKKIMKKIRSWASLHLTDANLCQEDHSNVKMKFFCHSFLRYACNECSFKSYYKECFKRHMMRKHKMSCAYANQLMDSFQNYCSEKDFKFKRKCDNQYFSDSVKVELKSRPERFLNLDSDEQNVPQDVSDLPNKEASSVSLQQLNEELSDSLVKVTDTTSFHKPTLAENGNHCNSPSSDAGSCAWIVDSAEKSPDRQSLVKANGDNIADHAQMKVVREKSVNVNASQAANGPRGSMFLCEETGILLYSSFCCDPDKDNVSNISCEKKNQQNQSVQERTEVFGPKFDGATRNIERHKTNESLLGDGRVMDEKNSNDGENVTDISTSPNADQRNQEKECSFHPNNINMITTSSKDFNSLESCREIPSEDQEPMRNSLVSTQVCSNPVDLEYDDPTDTMDKQSGIDLLKLSVSAAGIDNGDFTAINEARDMREGSQTKADLRLEDRQGKITDSDMCESPTYDMSDLVGFEDESYTDPVSVDFQLQQVKSAKCTFKKSPGRPRKSTRPQNQFGYLPHRHNEKLTPRGQPPKKLKLCSQTMQKESNVEDSKNYSVISHQFQPTLICEELRNPRVGKPDLQPVSVPLVGRDDLYTEKIDIDDVDQGHISATDCFQTAEDVQDAVSGYSACSVEACDNNSQKVLPNGMRLRTRKRLYHFNESEASPPFEYIELSSCSPKYSAFPSYYSSEMTTKGFAPENSAKVEPQNVKVVEQAHFREPQVEERGKPTTFESAYEADNAEEINFINEEEKVTAKATDEYAIAGSHLDKQEESLDTVQPTEPNLDETENFFIDIEGDSPVKKSENMEDLHTESLSPWLPCKLSQNCETESYSFQLHEEAGPNCRMESSASKLCFEEGKESKTVTLVKEDSIHTINNDSSTSRNVSIKNQNSQSLIEHKEKNLTVESVPSRCMNKKVKRRKKRRRAYLGYKLCGVKVPRFPDMHIHKKWHRQQYEDNVRKIQRNQKNSSPSDLMTTRSAENAADEKLESYQSTSEQMTNEENQGDHNEDEMKPNGVNADTTEMTCKESPEISKAFSVKSAKTVSDVNPQEVSKRIWECKLCNFCSLYIRNVARHMALLHCDQVTLDMLSEYTPRYEEYFLMAKRRSRQISFKKDRKLSPNKTSQKSDDWKTSHKNDDKSTFKEEPQNEPEPYTIRPFVCAYCSKACRRYYSCLTHQRTKHCDKPYKVITDENEMKLYKEAQLRNINMINAGASVRLSVGKSFEYENKVIESKKKSSVDNCTDSNALAMLKHTSVDDPGSTNKINIRESESENHNFVSDQRSKHQGCEGSCKNIEKHDASACISEPVALIHNVSDIQSDNHDRTNSEHSCLGTNSPMSEHADRVPPFKWSAKTQLVGTGIQVSPVAYPPFGITANFSSFLNLLENDESYQQCDQNSTLDLTRKVDDVKDPYTVGNHPFSNAAIIPESRLFADCQSSSDPIHQHLDQLRNDSDMISSSQSNLVRSQQKLQTEINQFQFNNSLSSFPNKQHSQSQLSGLPGNQQLQNNHSVRPAHHQPTSQDIGSSGVQHFQDLHSVIHSIEQSSQPDIQQTVIHAKQQQKQIQSAQFSSITTNMSSCLNNRPQNDESYGHWRSQTVSFHPAFPQNWRRGQSGYLHIDHSGQQEPSRQSPVFPSDQVLDFSCKKTATVSNHQVNETATGFSSMHKSQDSVHSIKPCSLDPSPQSLVLESCESLSLFSNQALGPFRSQSTVLSDEGMETLSTGSSSDKQNKELLSLNKSQQPTSVPCFDMKRFALTDRKLSTLTKDVISDQMLESESLSALSAEKKNTYQLEDKLSNALFPNDATDTVPNTAVTEEVQKVADTWQFQYAGKLLDSAVEINLTKSSKSFSENDQALFSCSSPKAVSTTSILDSDTMKQFSQLFDQKVGDNDSSFPLDTGIDVDTEKAGPLCDSAVILTDNKSNPDALQKPSSGMSTFLSYMKNSLTSTQSHYGENQSVKESVGKGQNEHQNFTSPPLWRPFASSDIFSDTQHASSTRSTCDVSKTPQISNVDMSTCSTCCSSGNADPESDSQSSPDNISEMCKDKQGNMSECDISKSTISDTITTTGHTIPATRLLCMGKFHGEMDGLLRRTDNSDIAHHNQRPLSDDCGILVKTNNKRIEKRVSDLKERKSDSQWKSTDHAVSVQNSSCESSSTEDHIQVNKSLDERKIKSNIANSIFCSTLPNRPDQTYSSDMEPSSSAGWSKLEELQTSSSVCSSPNVVPSSSPEQRKGSQSNTTDLNQSTPGAYLFSMPVYQQESDSDTESENTNQAKPSPSLESLDNNMPVISPIEKSESDSDSPFGLPEFPTLTKCVHCDIFFTDMTMFAIHRGTHGHNNPLTCNMCGKICENKLDFMSHFVTGH